ncbi:hypothetical protein HN371_05085 [Candidatus Poribacteria bacterium]|mgnify:CR=1 FL=1|jgi:hypothetical protein|nr:hypothetical protein [Candidatus Poribacteria bacterium]MBT5535121.1 hypothetical protein [Candidatus Poribacteria bacterium]MBT7101478.1 hypothetical protein [Candidatus Poribacteria bacterium]MBT7805757.1 hypothetical protein [Candidatus Poribacteria bacterium]
MTSDLPDPAHHPTGVSVTRPPHSVVAGRPQMLRRSAATPVSTKLLLIGAAVGGGGVFTSVLVAGVVAVLRDGGSLLHALPGGILGGVLTAVFFGAPTGAMVGVFLGSLRRPPKR